MRIERLLAVAVLSSASACMKGPGFLKQVDATKPQAITAAVTPTSADGPTPPTAPQMAKVLSDDGEKVVAQIAKGSTLTQTMQASATSSIAQTVVAFPPGALAFDTEITLEEAAPIVSSVLAAELGLPDDNSLSTAGQSVAIQSSTGADATAPFTLSVALDASFGAGLRLTASDYERIVISYKAFIAAENRYVYGLIPNGELAFDGLLVSFKTSYFGVYQPTLAEKPITVAPAPVAATTGIVTKRDAAAQPLTTLTDVRASFNPDTRDLGCSATASAALGRCSASFFSPEQKRKIAHADALGVAAASVKVPATEQGQRSCSFACIDTLGRTIVSELSAAVEVVGQVAAPTPAAPATPVSPGPNALPVDPTPVNEEPADDVPTSAPPSFVINAPVDDDDLAQSGGTMSFAYLATDTDSTPTIKLFYKLGGATGCQGDPTAVGNGWSFAQDLPLAGRTVNATVGNTAGNLYYCVLIDDGVNPPLYRLSGKVEVEAPLAAPTGLSASPLNGQIDLTWGSVASAASYRVTYGPASDPTAARVILNAAGTSTMHTGALPGVVYAYQVAAISATGFPGTPSAEETGSTYATVTGAADADTLGGPGQNAFYDTKWGRHWAFAKEGGTIRYKNSTDGSSWSPKVTQGPTVSNRFALTYKVINDIPRVFLASDTTDSVTTLSVGTINVDGTITWSDTTLYTNDATVQYARTSLAIDSMNHLWIATAKQDRGLWRVRVRTSDVDASTGTAAQLLAVAVDSSVGDQPTAAPIVPLLVAGEATRLMLAVDAGGTVASYRYASGSWSKNTGGVQAWERLAGSSLGAMESISALLPVGQEILAGGNFRNLGGHVGADYLAVWDGRAFRAFPGPTPNGPVKALLAVGSKIYIGGEFTAVGNVTTGGLAVWDGLKWSSVGTTQIGNVLALEAIGADVYAGGEFTALGGDAGINYVARWDGSSWSELGTVTYVNGIVRALDAFGTRLYVGGDFVAPSALFAIWDTGGAAWASLTTFLTGSVFAISALSGSEVFIGGSISGNLKKYDGSTFLSLISPPGPIYALYANAANDVYFGLGSFVKAYTGSATAVAVTGFGSGSSALAFAPTTGGVLTAGRLFDASNLPVGLARLTVNGAGRQAQRLDSDLPADIHAVTFDADGDMYAAGNFMLASGNIAHVAKYDVASRQWIETCVSAVFTGVVKDLHIEGEILYAAGGFAIDGITNVASCNLGVPNSNWASMGFSYSTSYAIQVYDNEVYVGGPYGLKKWDGLSTWSALPSAGGSYSISGTVFAMAADSQNLYFGGAFPNLVVGGSSLLKSAQLAAYNNAGGGTFAFVSSDPLNNIVWSLATPGNGKLYVGGEMTSPFERVAWIEVATGNHHQLQDGVSSPAVYALAVDAGDTKVYVGGSFTSVVGGSATSGHFAVWDRASETFETSAPPWTGGIVKSLAAGAGKVLVGNPDGLSALTATSVAANVADFAATYAGDRYYLAHATQAGQIRSRAFDFGDGTWDGPVELAVGPATSPTLVAGIAADANRVDALWVDVEGVKLARGTGGSWLAEADAWLDAGLRKLSCDPRGRPASPKIYCLATHANGTVDLRVNFLAP